MSLMSEKEDKATAVVAPTEEKTIYNGVSYQPILKTWLIIIVLTFLFICNTGSIQSMNVAVGFVAKDLKFTTQKIQWIQSAYQLSSGCLLLLYVPLCDKFGAKNIWLFCGVLYTAFTIGCANAQTDNQFIVFRALQGAGACGVVPAGFGILAELIPIVEHSAFRSYALAVFSAGAPLGSGLGTIFGGLPTQYSAIGWRGIYAVFAGLGGTGTLIGLFLIPKSKGRNVEGGIDYLGAAIITVALTFIVFVLSQGPAVGWKTAYCVALLVIGGLLFFAFIFYEIWVERRGRRPMLRMSNFTRGRYLAINFIGLWGFASFITWDYWAGLYYAQVQGQDAKNIMLRYLPQSLGALAGGAMATTMLKYISTQLVFMLGCLCAMLANVIFIVSDIDESYWKSGEFFAFYLGITGACIVYTSGMLYSVNVVVPSEVTAAGGLFQVVTSLSSAFGLTFSTIVASAHINPDVPDQEFKYGFYVGMAYGIFSFLAAIPGLWNSGVLGKSGESVRVEELVVHHHEEAVFQHGVDEHDIEEAESRAQSKSRPATE